jgi:hypothetical protein
MANQDAPTGFSPVRHLKGGTIRYDGGFTIASAYDTSIFSGDLVSLAATRALKDIALTADGAANIMGVFAGCQYTAADGSVIWTPFWLADTVTKGSVDAEAFVYADPDIVYDVQADGTLAVTVMGQFVDMVSTHAGSAATGRSGEEINSASESNDILQCKVIGLRNGTDGITASDVTADHSRWEVIIAEHEYQGTLRSVA